MRASAVCLRAQISPLRLRCQWQVRSPFLCTAIRHLEGVPKPSQLRQLRPGRCALGDCEHEGPDVYSGGSEDYELRIGVCGVLVTLGNPGELSKKRGTRCFDHLALS